jgi:O26-antigen biosynthesis N-acetyl-L-fucosamine transferase
MRILIIVVYYLPSPVSCAKLIHDLAKELYSQGHNVSIVTTDEQISTDLQISNEEDVRVIRVRSGKIKSASKPVRMINECMLSRTIWHKGKQFFKNNSYDLIVYYSPTIFFGPLVKRLKKIYSCSTYLILRDIFPQWALDAGVLRKGLLYKFFKWMELVNYQAADYIGVEAPGNLDYFSKKNLANKYRLEVLYNWTTLFEENHVISSYRAQLGLQNKVVFFYGGNIGVAQDMDNIIRLAIHLRDESEAYFLLVGDGSEVSRLKSIINRESLTNIIIHPPVDQKQYQSMLKEFDVGLITLDRNLNTYNFPGKMLGYMYHAKPILASINSGNDLHEILQTHQAGMVCYNGEDEIFYKQALQLIKNPDMRTQMGMNGRKLLESKFSVSNAASQILSNFLN